MYHGCSPTRVECEEQPWDTYYFNHSQNRWNEYDDFACTDASKSSNESHFD